MTVSSPHLHPSKDDYPSPSPRVPQASPKSIGEVLKEEHLLDHITPPPPKYDFLTSETIELVKEWSVEQYKTRDIVLECMANISSDFYKQGHYEPALQTIREAWDCDRGGSCGLKEMRHANLELLRAKCYVGLMQYDEALEACAHSREQGNLEAVLLETTIRKTLDFVERLSNPKSD